MKSVTIKLENENFGTYNFSVDSKFTIILGDSGIGKTTLVNALNSGETMMEVSDGYILLPYPKLTFSILDESRDVSIRYLMDKVLEESIQLLRRVVGNPVDDKVIFYIDEGFKFHKVDKRIFRESPYLFLIINREKLSDVPYSVLDIKTIKGGYDKVLVTPYEKYYHLDIQKVYESDKLTQLVVEDSKSGFDLFSKVCENTVSSNGNGRFIDMLCEMKHTLFVADGFGFGQFIVDFDRELKDTPSNTLYLIDSLEAMLLQSAFCDKILKLSNMHIDKPKISCLNKEKYYTKVFKSFVKECNLGKPYTKSSLPECFDVDCCKAKNKGPCEFFMDGYKPELLMPKELYKLLQQINENNLEDEDTAEEEDKSKNSFSTTSRFS